MHMVLRGSFGTGSRHLLPIVNRECVLTDYHHPEVMLLVVSPRLNSWPLIFIIYINNFSSNLKNFALHFVDDTKIYTKISQSNPISTLQEDIKIC